MKGLLYLRFLGLPGGLNMFGLLLVIAESGAMVVNQKQRDKPCVLSFTFLFSD